MEPRDRRDAHPLSPTLAGRLPAIAGVAVLGLAVALVVATARDYGVTWDEGAQARYGELVVDYFCSGFQDRRANDFLSLRIYGPPFEAGAAWLYGVLSLPKWELRHLLTALFGLLSVPALIACARAAREPWLGPVAAIVLLTMPRFWGHLFANSKDVPFAAAFAVAMAALGALVAGRERGVGRVVVAGLAIGAAAALRPGGLPLLGSLLVVALLLALPRDATPAALMRAARDVVVRTVLAVAIAWLLMVVFWPWAHAAPFRHPVHAMVRAASLAKVYPVLFEGEVMPSNALPARYLAEFLVITTPLPLLLLAMVGLVEAARRQWRAPAGTAARVLLLFELWLLVPLAAAAVLRPNVYDGLRHFLFVLPAVALFAGLGVLAIVSVARRGAVRALAIVLLVGALLWPLPALLRLHPYQYTYFNELVGGLAGASGRYETDYWVASYREAMLWIAQRAREQGAERVRVLVAANELSFPAAAAYADADVEVARLVGRPAGDRLPAGVDYFVATYRHGMNAAFPDAPVVHQVGRDGVVFTTIKGRVRDSDEDER